MSKFVPRKIFSSADGDQCEQLAYVRETNPELYNSWRNWNDKKEK